MDWLEQQYIGLLSNRLRNYKRRSSELYNFSCTFCGDSENDKKKARGYVYSKKGKTLYHCHNCNLTISFSRFLERVDYQLFSQYQLDVIKNVKNEKVETEVDELKEFINKMKPPLYVKEGPLKGLKKISQLSADHPLKKYISKRLIPNPYHAKMFYCPKFFSWVNSIIPNKFDDETLLYDEERLLIPFIFEDKMHAFQGRSLDPSNKTRYITIVYDNSVPKIYGLDLVDFNKKVYVTEGPIDSMFLPNSIATAGGDLVATVKDYNKKNLVVVYDNEPDSKETIQKMDKAIMNGYNVCIFPKNFQFKDVNDAVMGGLSPEFVKHIIDTNTYRDLSAKLTLNHWKRV